MVEKTEFHGQRILLDHLHYFNFFSSPSLSDSDGGDDSGNDDVDNSNCTHRSRRTTAAISLNYYFTKRKLSCTIIMRLNTGKVNDIIE